MNSTMIASSPAKDLVDTPAMQISVQPFSIWLSNVARLQAESLRFCTRRMARDLQIAGRIATCRTPGDLASAQIVFINQAVEDYAELGQRLFAMAGAEFEDTAAAVA